tara:strand:+ start:2182 stop:5073 length:2892 start_codon:yes stop_codon:yes gene_type:complete
MSVFSDLTGITNPGGTAGDILGGAESVWNQATGGGQTNSGITHQITSTASTLVTNETPEQSINQDVGRWLEPRQGTDIGVPIIYGTRRIGGILIYQEVSANNNLLYRVYTLAEGEQQSWTTYVDNVAYASSKFYNSDSSLRHIDQTSFTGNDTGLGSGSGVTLGSRWTANHLCKGIATEILTFVFDAEKRADATNFEEEPFFESGLPKVEFEMTGKALVDSSGSSVSAKNPAWQLYDYLTNTRYGCGLNASLIDATSFTTAAGICDQVNNSITRHQSNIILDSRASLLTNIKQILATCNGRLHWIDGKYTMKIDDTYTGSGEFAFEEKHVIGGINIIANNKNERSNQVTATFVNPSKNWKKDEVSWPDKNRDEDGDGDTGDLYTAYLTADKNIPLRKTINLNGVTDYNQARYLAKQSCLRSRDALKVNFRCTSEAMDLIVGDVVTLTHSTPGWTAKEFRIRSISLNLDGTCSISAVEHSDSIYAWDYVAPPAGASDTNLPDVTSVTAPSGLNVEESIYTSIASGGTRLKVTVNWTNSTDTFTVANEVQFRKVKDKDGNTISSPTWVDAGATSSSPHIINDFEKGTFDFRVRAKNAVGNISDWTTLSNQLVSGVGLQAPAVTGFEVNILEGQAQISWDTPDDIDIQTGGKIQIRNLQVGSTSWEEAEILAEVASTTTSVLLPLVEGNYVAKWIGSDGGESVSFVESGLGTVYWTNTIETINYHPAFAGTKTNLIVADNDGTKVLKFAGSTNIDDITQEIDGWIKIDEMGGVATSGSYVADAKDMGQVFKMRIYTKKNFTSGVSDTSNYWDSKGLVDSLASIDEIADLAGITTYIRTTEDDPASGSASWTDYKKFLIADVRARGLQLKVEFDNDNASEQFRVTALSLLVDMTSKILGGYSKTASSITYDEPFHSVPTLTITPTNMTSGDYFQIPTQTATGFVVNFYDSGGAGITRNFNYLSKGNG